MNQVLNLSSSLFFSAGRYLVLLLAFLLCITGYRKPLKRLFVICGIYHPPKIKIEIKIRLGDNRMMVIKFLNLSSMSLSQLFPRSKKKMSGLTGLEIRMAFTSIENFPLQGNLVTLGSDFKETFLLVSGDDTVEARQAPGMPYWRSPCSNIPLANSSSLTSSCGLFLRPSLA